MFSQFVAKQLGNPSGWFGRQILTHFLNRGNQELIANCIRKLELKSNDHFLDLGFGGGVSLELAHEIIKEGKVVGVDRSSDIVQRGKRQYSEWIAQATVELVESDVADLPFPTETFSKISTINTIYFWPNLPAGLQELRRVLRKDGKLCIAICGPEKMQSMHWVTRHGFRIYSPQEVSEQLHIVGFSRVQREALSGNTVQGDWLILAEND